MRNANDCSNHKRPGLKRQRPGLKRRRNGFTLIELMIVIAVIGILAAAAVPNFAASNKSANEASAVASMRALISAQETYHLSHKDYGVLTQLKDAGIVNPLLGSGSKSGYTFITFGDSTSTNFAFVAKPQLNRGDRWYFVDQTGVIRYAMDDSIGPDSPELK